MRSIALIIAFLAAAAAPLDADADQFDQGSFSLGLGGSLQFGGDRTVFVASVGLGYFVLDGLEVGVGTAAWFGARPFVTQVTPGIRYIFWMVPVVHPYVGGFYRHWFIGAGERDLDTVGGRAGLLLVPTPAPVVVGLGLVYERIVNPPCDTDCASIHPELAFSISF